MDPSYYQTTNPPPCDGIGSGRIVKTIRLEPSHVLEIIRNTHIVDSMENQPTNPLPQNMQTGGTMTISTTANSFLRESRREGTILITNNSILGTIILLVKEVQRIARPNEDLMEINKFLNQWPGCSKKEFLNRNYVKAGKDTLLQRYRYVIPKSLPWHWIFPRRTPEGLYVSDVSFVAETLNSRKASSLLINMKSPHFIAYYPVLDSSNNISNILIEQCDMCMSTDFRTTGRPEKKLQSYLIQSLLAIRAMQNEFKMVHNDLFVYSLSVKRVRMHTLWSGEVMKNYAWWQYGDIYIERPTYIVKFTNFGFASSFRTPGGIVRNDIYSKELEEVGMMSSYAPQSDIMTLLIDFMENYECDAATSCLQDIAIRYSFANVESMLEQVLVRGANYRINPAMLPNLTIDWVIDTFLKHCLPLVATRTKPDIDTILQIE